MWKWHAVEEIEHKAVAFDTFRFATRNWPRGRRWMLKSIMMLSITVHFIKHRIQDMIYLLEQDGLTGWRVKARVLWYLFGTPGMLRRMIPAWFAYFLPGFHPWKHDDRHLIEMAEASLTKHDGVDRRGCELAARQAIALLDLAGGTEARLAKNPARGWIVEEMSGGELAVPQSAGNAQDSSTGLGGEPTPPVLAPDPVTQFRFVAELVQPGNANHGLGRIGPGHPGKVAHHRLIGDLGKDLGPVLRPCGPQEQPFAANEHLSYSTQCPARANRTHA
jgi:hypothetical protein